MSSEQRPNIIFILANEVGFGELGSFGQQQMLTPHLDKLASQGVRLTQHYSGGPMSALSQGVLMTGQSKGHCFLSKTPQPNQPDFAKYYDRQLPSTQVTLGEQLKTNGYATGLFGQWSLGGNGSTGDPTKRGFERFYGFKCSMEARMGYPTHLWDNDQQIEVNPNSTEHHFAPDLINEQALAFINQKKSEPFFLFYPMIMPSASKHPSSTQWPSIPPEWEATYGNPEKGPYISRRMAVISKMDQYVGSIIDTLAELDLTRNTIVVFSSAHGPTALGGYDSTDTIAYSDEIGASQGEALSFPTTFIPGGETGKFNAAGLPTAKSALPHPYLAVSNTDGNHKYDPLMSTGLMRAADTGELAHQEGNLRVPTIVSWPGNICSGTWNSWVSGFEDWSPTLLELAGISDAATESTDSFSLAPMLKGISSTLNPRYELYREFATSEETISSLRVGQYKLIQTSCEKTHSLYDIEWDLLEDSDLANYMLDTAKVLLTRMDFHLKRD